MSNKYRTGIIGFGHMHINNVAARYSAHPQVEWVACADTQPLCPELRVAPYTRQWNRRHVIEQFGIPKDYASYREMLAQEKLDVVIVTCENAQHAEVIEACAAAGIHVCVEKPMSTSLAAAVGMDRACRAAGVRMAVNWPTSFLPQVRKAQELIVAGAIGRVLEVRCRIGHTGPLGTSARHEGVSETAAPMTGAERAATWWHQVAAGGGAMLDFCCYGAKFARWYIGEPAAAAVGLQANVDSTWGEAEDNGAILIRFPQAVAVTQGSWTTLHEGGVVGPVIYGTTGTMIVDLADEKAAVRIERIAGQSAEIHEADSLPEGRTNIAEEFLHHLETDEPLHATLTPEFNLEVMAILDAGLRSTSSGHWETVDKL
jgi:predicted dehydrogenase